MRISGYYLDLCKIPDVKMLPYPHQAKMFAEWDKQKNFMLITKTGSGKTRAVALPVVHYRESAVFVYPTNALIADQIVSIKKLLDEEQIAYREITPDNIQEKWGKEEYGLIQINADLLAEYKEKLHLKSKGDALALLLKQDKAKIILVNPDILYLITSLRYGKASAELITHLAAYKTLVLDEFHMYTGVELSNLLFMLFLCKDLNIFERVVLLSATPNQEVLKYVHKILAPYMIDVDSEVNYPVVGKRKVVHPVELLPVITTPDNLLDDILKIILDSKAELMKLRKQYNKKNASGKYVPCVIILNSVMDAIQLEDRLVEKGIKREDIAPIRGLTSRTYRSMQNKLITIGTSAIEVGIDFDADYLVFEASDTASFLQRFGRIGRHKIGRAYLIADKFQQLALESFGTKLHRSQLESLINAIYPYRNARAWFLSTFSGMVSVFALAHKFYQLATDAENGGANANPELKSWLEKLLNQYAAVMGWQKSYQQMLPKMERQWFQDYLSNLGFRASMQTYRVWDKKEQQRGRAIWSYDADLRVILRKSVGISLDEKDKKLYIQGYVTKGSNKVYLQSDFAEYSAMAGTMQTTRNFKPAYLNLLVNGGVTPLSGAMCDPNHHLFVFVPRDAVMAFVDWRIAWFNCGESGDLIAAFDNDALLLREIYMKYRANGFSNVNEE